MAEIVVLVVILILVLPVVAIAVLATIKHRKETRCPNCGKHTLVLVKDNTVFTGEYKNEINSCSPMRTRIEVLQENKNYKCSYCGYETTKTKLVEGKNRY